MSAPFADLVLPAIRWDDTHGFEPARASIEHALEAGVGGFIIFDGERTAVQALTRDLRAAADGALLIASDLERGAGQQVRGLTALPPLMALARLGESVVREAAQLTAREARDVGINWALAPVCDLDIEPRNPIVGTRAFGADAFDVAHLAGAWIDACQAEGVLACAKHFPGHGRTTADSHIELPVVDAGRELERDLMPFRRVVAGDVASVMTAHVAYPAWDGTGVAATYSRTILDLLRHDLFFEGLIVTDALIMEGALTGGGEADEAVRAVRAGCDLLLYPHDLDAVLEALGKERGTGRHSVSDLGTRAGLRRAEAAARAAEPAPLPDATIAANRERGAVLCAEAIWPLRDDVPRLSGSVRIEIVDDDAGGPYPLPPRSAFADELGKLGVEVSPRGRTVVALFADVKSWKARAGLSAGTLARLATLLEPKSLLVLFGHPRRQQELAHAGPVLCAWSGDEGMQRAAARRLAAG